MRSVVGADFAQNRCDTILYDDVYDIAKGADYGEKESTGHLKVGHSDSII